MTTLTESIDTVTGTAVWWIVVALLAVAIAAASLAFWPPNRLRVTSAKPVRLSATGVLTIVAAIALFAGIVLAFLPLAPPNPGIHVILGVFALALATIGGGPVAVLALRLATRGAPSTAGPNGGIIIANPTPPASPSTGTVPAPAASGSQEVLRGGTTIGILERIAVAGCVIAGFPEGIAVVVAVKGVGRFTELSTPEAKERFIIGTLASFVWACACTVIVR
jgi:hypothetical protein